MKENTTRPGAFGTGRSIWSLALMVLGLCAVSFYLGGAFYSTQENMLEENAGGSAAAERTGCIPIMKVEAFPVCNITLQDSTPCQDPKVGHLVPLAPKISPNSFPNEHIQVFVLKQVVNYT